MSSLRLSAPDWCFFKSGMDPDAYYRGLADAGYTAVEMAAPERRDAARRAGISLLNVSGPGMTEGLNHRKNHAKLLPALRDAIRDAAGAGIPHVIVFSGNRDGLDDAAGSDACRRGLEAVLPDAERAGVTLVFEMLNSFDHADYQADRSAFGFHLIRKIGSPRLRVLYDIYHMARMGENVVRDLTENADCIAHLHVAGSPRRDFPGEAQDIDYAAAIRAATRAGYDGYWGMEFLPKKPDEIRAAAVRWRELSRAAVLV